MAGVSDVGFSGSRYTWCNNRGGQACIWNRLDRLLCNPKVALLGMSMSVQHLGREPSDHAPLLVSASTRLDNKPKPFCFLNVWTSKEDLLDAEEAVLVAETDFDTDPSQRHWLALQEAHAVMRNSLIKEEAYWKQKARIKWLQDGDKNTKFFHAVVAERRSKSIIHRIRSVRGEWLTDEE
ncbi:uncharacterized protein LOC113758554 [Coffea eugenioides]|uniref:uncharacterized protein LOC113758554 n=1 Tax=Coffea eugenioides TaxID=49369 RepID=UPI000F60A05C|nr:uncharacterized protein LOC113758554 [Coffea eugenioides]